MNLDTLIPLWMKHNATIIESLIGLSLLITAFLSIRSFLNAKNPSAISGGSLGIDASQLEKTLQQILEKAGQVPSVAAAGTSGSASSTASGGGSKGSGGGNSEDGSKLLIEITNLKTDLQAKQRQIEDLKASPAAAAPGMSESEKLTLSNQVQELRAKLAEYEIISEDIADLSFYKEQNIKLQKELEAYRSGEASVPGKSALAATEAPASTPMAEEKTERKSQRAEPEIVGRSAHPASDLEVADQAAEAMAAFADQPADQPADQAVDQAVDQAADQNASSPDKDASSESALQADVDNSIDDDLMAEFAAAVEKQKAQNSGSGDAKADLGNLDMDKMLIEAANISTDGPEIDADKALGTGFDENKLLKEAVALDSISNEDKNLMGQFENFVKKSE